MKNPKMGDKVKVRYRGPRCIGGFAIVSTPKENGVISVWDDAGFTCREDFQDVWSSHRDKQTEILFLHADEEKPQHVKAIAAALIYVEETIGIKGRSIVHPTSRKDITYIKLAKWWVQFDIRKSFLTILLRAAVHNAYRKNFYSSLFKIGDPQGFFKETPFAVKRFLKGYTKTNNTDMPMWMEMFYSSSEGYFGSAVKDEIVKSILYKKR